jgi:hypothetical protein
MNKPKLVHSKTIQKVKDHEFYTELIRQCEEVLPMVDDHTGICYLCDPCYNCVEDCKILQRVSNSIPRMGLKIDGYFYYSPKMRSLLGYKYTPTWKQDRIELLEEIINYCKSKL